MVAEVARFGAHKAQSYHVPQNAFDVKFQLGREVWVN